MHKYFVVKEDKKDFKKSVIKKTNIEADFTLEHIEEREKQIEQKLVEFKAALDLSQAKMTNIEKNHKFVLDFTPKQYHALTMYLQERAIVKELQPEIKRYEERLVASGEEKDEVYKQIGFIKVEDESKS